MYRFALLAVAAIALGCSGGPRHKLSDLQAFESKIKVGMKDSDVVAIAGKPTSTSGTGNTVVYFYYVDDPMQPENLAVGMKNGVVVYVKLMKKP